MKDKLTDYFNGNIPDEEQHIQQWLAQNADSPLVSEEMEKLFDSCEGSIADPSRVASVFDAVTRKLSLRRTKTRGRRVAGYALSGVVAVSLSLVFFTAGNRWGRMDAGSVEWIEERVPNASTRQLQLSDGTILTLAPGTRITYPDRFTGSERRIFVDGELFAEVAKNSECPFIISSEGTQVKVLGTTFDFKSFSGSSDVELSLVEGCVQMQFTSRESSRQVTVTPGQCIRYDRNTSELRTERFDAASYRPLFEDTSSFYYNNVRLHDIAADLSRRFDRKIVITDERLAQTKFFAIFTNNESVDKILRTIALNHNMKVNCSDGVYYISSKK